MVYPEAAYWLATLEAPHLRKAAKRLLYRWCIEEAQPAAALANASDTEFEEMGLDATQSAALRAALAQAPDYASTLERLASQGIHLLTRGDTAYPDLWLQRLDEEYAPYRIYYTGDLALLCQPGMAIIGAAEPSASARDFIRGTASMLAKVDCPMVCGYQKGISRLCAESVMAGGGNAVAVLPLGLEASSRLLAELAPLIESDRLLVLSPFPCEAMYSEPYARARLPLISGLCDMLLAIEPDTAPAPYTDALTSVPSLCTWQGESAACFESWLAKDAVSVSDWEQVTTAWQAVLDGSLQSGQTEPNQPERPFTPITFQDADSAIAALSQSGTVPEALARRLREHSGEWYQ